MALPVVDSPANWHGVDLASSNHWKLELSPQHLAELQQTIEQLRAKDRRYDEVAAEEFTLPTLRPLLLQIQQSLETGSGVCLLRGIPSDWLDEQNAHWLQWALCTQIGTPVSQSPRGERIFRVEDAGFDDQDRRARGPNTRKKLHFHTDRCDIIGFLCVRQAAEGGYSDVVSSVHIYNRIARERPDLCRVLMEPFYYQRHNVDTANSKPYCRQPVFSFCEGHFAGNMLRVLIERAYAAEDTPAMTDVQREALDMVETVAEDSYHRFMQQPGDLLLINNWVTFHRRTAFVDQDDPQAKRLLLRIWLAPPNSRPLDPLFADNYGQTEAGAIRGGMASAN